MTTATQGALPTRARPTTKNHPHAGAPAHPRTAAPRRYLLPLTLTALLSTWV